MTNIQKLERRRAEIAVTLIFVGVIVLISLALVAFAESPKEVKYMSYIVKSGDTLWGISEKYQQGVDIREMVGLLITENSIEGHRIYVGEVLQIPIIE